MVGFVLVLAVANLAIGYIAAAALVEPPLWSGLGARFRRPVVAVHVAKVPPTTSSEPVVSSPQMAPTPSLAEIGQEGRPTVAGIDELPAGWLVQLASEGIVAH